MTYSRYLTELKKQSPLVHNMTNQVVANYVANGLLALGTSPIMAYAKEEMNEIAGITQATALNIGTLTQDVFESMLIVAKKVNELNHPLILDPVGVGASQFRKNSVLTLLKQFKFTLIRGNAGEIATLMDLPWKTKGVDSGEGDFQVSELAKKAAQQFNTMVAVSGEIDWISDGNETYGVKNGQELMTKVTGMGCLLTAVCGAFLAIENSLISVVSAHAFYGLAGDKAKQKSDKVGGFQIQFLDELFMLSEQDESQLMIIND